MYRQKTISTPINGNAFQLSFKSLPSLQDIHVDTNDKHSSAANEEECVKVTDEKLKTQMQTLKKIIEVEEIKNQVLSFVVADFIQDHECNWYFLSMVNYKYEVSLPKIIPQKPKKIKFKVRKPATKSLANMEVSNLHSQSFNKAGHSKELLTQEVLRDLLDSL